MKVPGMKLTYLLLSAIVIMATACTSSDSNSTAPVVSSITKDNIQKLAIAGTEGVKQSVQSASTPVFAKTPNESPIQELTVSLAQQIAKDPQFELIAGICDSGTVDVVSSGTGSSITYNSCVIDGNTYDGSAVINTTTAGNIQTTSISYTNFTVIFNGETTTLNLDMTCTTNSSTLESSCSYNSQAEGIDGRTYNVSNSSVTGNEFSGYTVSATVTDPQYGQVTVTTDSAITFTSCSNGQPGSGQISVSDGTNNTMTVTFNSCTSYTVVFEGVSESFTW